MKNSTVRPKRNASRDALRYRHIAIPNPDGTIRHRFGLSIPANLERAKPIEAA